MVTVNERERRIFHLFANLLTYPLANLADSALACEALLAEDYPEAAACLRELRQSVVDSPLCRLQEIYTITFDLDAVCHPYVGHHLFGESYKRSAFMLALTERYQKVGLDSGSEVADHLAVLLRFLSLCQDQGEIEVIARDALVPALRQMVKEKNEVETEGEKLVAGKIKRPRIYQAVLEALLHMLQSLPEGVRRP
jgi:nitrate reductase delta subunit